ncbi:hypothetical protein ACSBR2_037112 [Camellia fascicularis]
MEEQKLELRLGPPGDHDSALLTLGYNSNSNSCGIKRGLESTLLEVKTGGERNWLTNNKSTGSTNTQKRIAVAPVVGWPPIGSFRKNLATSSSPKAAFESPNEVSKVLLSENVENPGNSLFVKVKMDGVPIGRKIDLKAYNNYETLSSAVDELFRSLLAAQMHHSVNLEGEEMVEKKAISGLSEGNGEYTLVYEDNEGDRMLAGDVPWHMFVSTVKRLRVLKTSELSSVRVNSKKLGQAQPGSETKA